MEGLKNKFSKIKENVLLSEYTTFKIGGPAKYLINISETNELKNLIQETFKLNIPFLVIGRGSNILFSSKGYDGLVIVFNAVNPVLKDGESIYASTPLSYLVSNFKNFSGFEWAVGIPGTLAGAINGNAGAFGKSMADIVKNVDVLEIKNKKIIEKKYSNKDCKFSYRNSIFKNNPNLIIVSATLKMIKEDEQKIKEKIRENISKRMLVQSKGFSAGSIFKNYEGEVNGIKNPSAGFLLEKAGLKGKQIGGAKISEEHANFIINLGDATSDDVLKLIDCAKQEVKRTFLVDLEVEIKIF